MRFRSAGRLLRRAALALLLLGTPGTVLAEPAGPAYDARAWREDFDQLKTALEKGYVNLAWMGSVESGVDLPVLERRTRKALQAARSDEEGRSAIRGFVDGFHDGHFSQLSWLAKPQGAVEPEPADRLLDPADAASGCAALGYASTGSVPFSLPFESLPGFVLTSDGLAEPFRTGLVPAPDGRKIGVIRLQNFETGPFPATCLKAWAELRQAGRPITEDSIEAAARMAWFAGIAERLAAFRAAGASAVIVDIGNDSGGDDSGDWAARLFTDRPLASARLMMAAGPAADKYFDEEAESLAGGLAKRPGPADATALEKARGFFQAAKASIGEAAACDLSWVWRERRPWAGGGCRRLVDGGFAGGALSGAPKGGYSSETAALLSGPSRVEAYFGAWTGPVYVLTDSRSYSSAEMFAAVMQDNHVARLIGARTGGDGCGFMVSTPPTVLTHSRLRFRMPNCMRLRADGTNEVAGVSPDIALPRLEGESSRARAARALRVIAQDLDTASPAP